MATKNPLPDDFAGPCHVVWLTHAQNVKAYPIVNGVIYNAGDVTERVNHRSSDVLLLLTL